MHEKHLPASPQMLIYEKILKEIEILCSPKKYAFRRKSYPALLDLFETIKKKKRTKYTQSKLYTPLLQTCGFVKITFLQTVY